MYSLTNVLGIARNAISAHQIAVQVASENIANAQTEGYSRKRVTLSSGTSIRTPQGPSASGVQIRDVARVRDVFHDQSYRRDAARAGSYGLRRDLMQRVESIFGEPSETGLGSTLDAFWSSWSDLANEPTSSSARNMVRQRGTQVTAVLNRAAAELNTQADAARSRLSTTVGEINRLSGEIASLNDQVVSAEVGGRTASDLRDSRDLAVDRLARLASVTATERWDGSISVLVENTTMVDGGSFKTLAVDSSGASVTVETSSGTPLSVASEGSALAEILNVINTEIPGVQTQLDDLAAALVSGVNGIYALGAGGTAGEFFDSGFTAADTLALSSSIAADASTIAAGYSTASGDNELALDMAGLQTDSSIAIGATTGSYGGYYRDMIAGIAVTVSSAENSTQVYETLANQSDLRRQSVSGVSVDEELINMMQHQQAYAAATRVVSAVDEMLQSLLNMV